jgi:hypothetical protein
MDSTNLSTTVTATIPTHAAGDLAIIFLAGRPPNTTDEPATPSGWTKRSSSISTAPTSGGNLKLITYYQAMTSATEPAVTFTLGSWGGVTGQGGMSATVGLWSGVDRVTIFDVADVKNFFAASAQMQPLPAITTVTKGARVVSAVTATDTSKLEVATPVSFVARMFGNPYQTSQGANHSLGVADKTQVDAGLVTMLTWDQNNNLGNGADPWAWITFALRPNHSTGRVCP